jgi:hypothetical protein
VEVCWDDMVLVVGVEHSVMMEKQVYKQLMKCWILVEWKREMKLRKKLKLLT